MLFVVDVFECVHEGCLCSVKALSPCCIDAVACVVAIHVASMCAVRGVGMEHHRDKP